MNQYNASSSVQQHIGWSGVDLEGMRHPAIFVVRGRIDERSLFHKSFDVRSGVGESDRDDIELRRLAALIEFAQERQITLAHVAPRRPEDQQYRPTFLRRI